MKGYIERYGLTVGCKKTAEKLNRTTGSCTAKCKREGLWDTENSGPFYNPDIEEKIAKYLKRKISKNPNNLMDVFRDAAIKFNLTEQSIANRWYGVKVRRNGRIVTDFSTYPSYKGNIGVVFCVMGKSSTVNGKNQKKPSVNKTGWIMAIFRKFLKKYNK